MSASSGETNITTLLCTLQPLMNPTVYVFASLPADTIQNSQLQTWLLSRALMVFKEPAEDSITYVLTQATAQDVQSQGLSNFKFEFECKKITIHIHSSLAAVGFMPVLTGALAARGISCNPVSGFYSDHLFVPAQRGDEALAALVRVRSDARAKAGFHDGDGK